MIDELRKAWERFWALSWWWKGGAFGVTGFILLAIIASATGGGDEDSDDGTATPTPTVSATETATESTTASPSPTASQTASPSPSPSPTVVATPPPTAAPTQPPAQPPAAVPTDPPQQNCDPSYPTVCIAPYPPDLNFGDVPFTDFTVVPPDPHGFDGNHDGIGCVS